MAFLAPDDEILSCTGEGNIEQIQVIHPKLQAFVQVIIPVDRFRHLCGIINGKDIQPIERGHLRGTPHKLTVRLVLQLPVAERKKYRMELQSFGFVYGEDADALHLAAWNRLAAQRFVPITDESVELGRITLQIICHCIEKGEQVSVLIADAVHLEDTEKFLQKFVERH